MDYISIKISENYNLYKYGTNNTIHKSGNDYQKPTIGYGYDIKQQGFNAEDLNSKAGATIITQEQMDLLKSYCNALVKGKDESDDDYNNRVKLIKENYNTLISSVTITQSQANTLLNNTVSSYEAALNNILNEYGATLLPYQKSALISVFYNTCGGTVDSIKSKHSTLVALLAHLKTSNPDEKKFIGSLGIWYEILYRTNPNSNDENQYGIQNRRFLEANEFWGITLSQTPSSASAQSIIPINSYEEANIAIAFMNQKKDAMKNKLDDITNYKNNSYKYIRDNFSSAVSVFLSNQNYTGTYNIDTLFKDWNLYTDLQINTSTGTTSYGNITGSDKRDLIFITGEQDGTTVHADAGDDFVGGSSKRDIVYSGSGNDVIYTYGGNDEVHTTDGLQGDYNQVYLGAGSDAFYGGDGDDFVDGGSGRIDLSHVSSNIGAEDATTDVNNVSLGGGQNRYIGGIGKDKVQGTGYNTVYLGAGSDEYIGGDGVDIVDGGSDTSGYSADGIFDINTIHLGGGDDRYIGGKGKDIVWSGWGNDYIFTGEGSDHVYTNDTNKEDETKTVYLGGGDDYFTGGAANDIVDGGKGLDEDKEENKNHIDLGDGNNSYVGGKGEDYVTGGANNDYIDLGDGRGIANGGAGDDDLKGGEGSQTLIGGEGSNIMDPGANDGDTDTVVTGTGAGTDIIKNFGEEDILIVSRGIKDTTTEGNDLVITTTEDRKVILKDWGKPEDEEEPRLPLNVWDDQGNKYVPDDNGKYSCSIAIPTENILDKIIGEIKDLFETAEETRSPLVLDLDGDGIETITADSGVYFDHDGNLFQEKTAWVAKDDALLVRDIRLAA